MYMQIKSKNSPFDIFVENLFTQQEIENAKANAVDADIISPADEVIEAFSALPPNEQDMLMAKLVARYHPDKIKMYLSWAQKYK
jgi:2-oxoglutarate dehydrogenase complex dehydrogenase (E1) component-like enzyme